MSQVDDGGMGSSRKAGAWDALVLVGGMIPGVSAIAGGVARSSVQRLLGFWMMWHLYGGLAGLMDAGVMSQATAYRQRTEFRRVFGLDVDEFGPSLALEVQKAGGRHESA